PIDRERLGKALLKLGIPSLKKVTVFGGYTGEFALALRDIGVEVLFTDPMRVWVERAKLNGFKVDRRAAEGMSGDMIGDSEAMATFECYMPFTNEALSMYTSMRFLTTSFGIIFAESDSTRNEMRGEMLAQASRGKQTPSMMSYLKLGYGLESAFTNAGGLRIYRFSIPERTKPVLLLDLVVLKSMHDLIRDEKEVDAEDVHRVAQACGLGREEVTISMKRMSLMTDLRLKREFPSLSPQHNGRFWIGAKMFSFRNWD
ncbi:MAG: hypothetical protein WCK39_10485, partial [Methanomassiliicoccales archaeon]